MFERRGILRTMKNNLQRITSVAFLFLFILVLSGCSNDTTSTNSKPNLSQSLLSTQQGETKNVESPAKKQPETLISTGIVKKSSTGICHQPGSTYYVRTKNYTTYNSIKECLNSGGRMPKR